ncbi:hypothetical protein SRHO_G00274320 [Serrasalmus rhombeus]
MQVSFVCTDHRSMSRSTDDRLNRQNANSPNTGTRSKFRAVAMVARSLGQLSVQSVPSSSDQSMRTGMKYRFALAVLSATTSPDLKAVFCAFSLTRTSLVIQGFSLARVKMF